MGEISIYVASGKSKATLHVGKFPVYGSTGIIGYSDQYDYSGDAILIARVGANAGKLNLAKNRYGTDNTIILNLESSQILLFFLYQLQSLNLNSLVFGSGQPLITGTQIKNLMVRKPSVEEQQAITEVLTDIDAEISALEAQRQKTLVLKQGMMQDLLTGKVRLL